MHPGCRAITMVCALTIFIVQNWAKDRYRYFCYTSPRNSEANPSQRGQHMATPTVASKKLLLCEADAMVKKLCAKASARESEAQD